MTQAIKIKKISGNEISAVSTEDKAHLELGIKELNSTNWNDWLWQLENRITTVEQLERWLLLTPQEKKAIMYSTGNLAVAVTPHYLSLMDRLDPECPIRRQAIPSLAEFRLSPSDLSDPRGDYKNTVAPGVVQKHQDRVKLIVTNACAVHCRFCTQKRTKSMCEDSVTDQHIEQGIAYISKHEKIRDVVLSGGDPLMLPNSKLELILNGLRSIPHVEIVRIDTRIPISCPQRIDTSLVKLLKKFNPLYINVSVNHKKEISAETAAVLSMLADAGFPLGSQTTLLRGVNDRVSVIKELMQTLLKLRVRPYYLFQCDLTNGTEHFRAPLLSGVHIIESLMNQTSGLALPRLCVNAPDNLGSITVEPCSIVSVNDRGIILKNHAGKVYLYPEKRVGF